jgi:hypothetical protein
MTYTRTNPDSSCASIFAFLGFFSPCASPIRRIPQDPHWGFATDLGLWTGTTNNTTFALGFRPRLLHGSQFFVRRDGPLHPGRGDLTQIGVAACGQIPSPSEQWIQPRAPLPDLAILHADLNRRQRPGTKIDPQRHQPLHSAGHVTGISGRTKNRLLHDPHGESAPHHPLATRPRTTTPAWHCSSAFAGGRSPHPTDLAPYLVKESKTARGPT